MESISIRTITDLKGCANVQRVHGIAWAAATDDLVPSHILITLAKNECLLLGAYAADGPAETEGMVGFALGWYGVTPGSGGVALKYCSHIVGVLPGWRGRSVGLRLKLAQREAILAQGLTDHVTWTYDPLQRVNGALNIHRLGATCVTYLRNVYGTMTDALNAGAPSDRCQVDWKLRSSRVQHALAADRRDPPWDNSTLAILGTHRTGQGFARPAPYHLDLAGNPIAVPLPDDVAALRHDDPALLLEWRLYLRDVLEQGFAAGYSIVDCIELPNLGWHYILATTP